jgi:NAD(P)-dependent dehydrogenase (short-subunit alcohol dehydrogenase family)
MRILVIGASGTIGREIVKALEPSHEVLQASRAHTPFSVDISNPQSIRALYQEVGTVDAVVCAAGTARFAPLDQLSDGDFEFSLQNKLMGQVNLVRLGFGSIRDGGSVTLSGGVLARTPTKGGAAFSLVNAALEGFVRASALEATRGIRVNIVSPPWVTETLIALKMDPAIGLPAAAVARAYVQSVTGQQTGAVIEPTRLAAL